VPFGREMGCCVAETLKPVAGQDNASYARVAAGSGPCVGARPFLAERARRNVVYGKRGSMPINDRSLSRVVLHARNSAGKNFLGLRR
jgi:hypothetical protein